MVRQNAAIILTKSAALNVERSSSNAATEDV